MKRDPRSWHQKINTTSDTFSESGESLCPLSCSATASPQRRERRRIFASNPSGLTDPDAAGIDGTMGRHASLELGQVRVAKCAGAKFDDASSQVQRAEEAVRRARQLREWHLSVLERCRASVVAALEAGEVNWTLRRDTSQSPTGWRLFLRALVDGQPRLAIWPATRLLVHPELAKRAEVMIQLDRIFQSPEEAECSARADREDPVQAALTLMRAADEILDLDLRLQRIGAPNPSGEPTGCGDVRRFTAR